MRTVNNTGGVYFNSPSSSGLVSGEYIKTDSGYYSSGSNFLFIGSSCQKGRELGLWRKTPSGTKYISSLKPHSNSNTYYFDTLPDRTPHLLILKEDKLRIVRIGGSDV